MLSPMIENVYQLAHLKKVSVMLGTLLGDKVGFLLGTLLGDMDIITLYWYNGWSETLNTTW